MYGRTVYGPAYGPAVLPTGMAGWTDYRPEKNDQGQLASFGWSWLELQRLRNEVEKKMKMVFALV